MERTQFKDYMMSGLGRAYLELKKGDKEQYRDIVQWAALNSMTINNQSDGTPDEYVYRMIRCYDDPETFLTAIINAYIGFPFDADEDKFYYLTRLLGRFIEDGFEAAEAALWRKYEEFRALLGAHDFEPKYEVNAEDTAFCVICEELYHRVPEEKRKKIINDIGAICVTLNEISRINFTWFLYDLYSKGLEEEILKFIGERTPENDAFALNYGDFLLDHRIGYGLEKEKSLLTDRIYAVDPDFDKENEEDGNDADEKQEEEISEEDSDEEYDDEEDGEDEGEYDEDEEEDEDDEDYYYNKYGLYVANDEENSYDWNDRLESAYVGMCREASRPYRDLLKEGDALLEESRFDELVRCLEYFDKDVYCEARELFIRCKHSRALDYARNRIAAGKKEWWTTTLLLRNYRKRDKGMLLYTLYNMKRDFEEGDGEWHPVVYDIIGMKCDFGVVLPTEFFRFIYERSICRHCRYYAVQELYERKALTDEEQNECYYDAEEDIRAFAKEHDFRKLPL